MRKLHIFALLAAAALAAGCAGGGQKKGAASFASVSLGKGKEAEVENEVIARSWQGAVAENFDFIYTLFNIGVGEELFGIVDEANEHGIDIDEFEDHGNKVMKVLDELYEKYSEELKDSEPYSVSESDIPAPGDFFAKAIGSPDDLAAPDKDYLESVFKALKDNAVSRTPIPVVRAKEIDEKSGICTYIFENCNAIAEVKGNEIKVSVPDRDEVFAFLQKVFPNTIDLLVLPDPEEITTPRFTEYSRLECDYDPIYCTQDAYAWSIDPNPIITEYKPWPNAYRVRWERYEQAEQVENIVVITMKDGKYLIDNILNVEDGKPALLFDYSKEPVSIWAE